MHTTTFIRARLAAINSATKYPSIPTYHALGDKGRLREERNVVFAGPVDVTEKLDGTNTRLIVIARTDRAPLVIVGSREELLYASDDLIHNPALGIVDGVREIADRAPAFVTSGALVLFGELFGGRITAASKQYTAMQAVAFRLFDALAFSTEALADVTGWEPARIAAWREAGKQPFLPITQLADLSARAGVERAPSCPVDAPPPASVVETYEWLRAVTGGRSRAVLDEGAGGRPEGVVVRDGARAIAKVRFEDYERTIGKVGARA